MPVEVGGGGRGDLSPEDSAVETDFGLPVNCGEADCVYVKPGFGSPVDSGAVDSTYVETDTAVPGAVGCDAADSLYVETDFGLPGAVG